MSAQYIHQKVYLDSPVPLDLAVANTGAAIAALADGGGSCHADTGVAVWTEIDVAGFLGAAAGALILDPTQIDTLAALVAEFQSDHSVTTFIEDDSCVAIDKTALIAAFAVLVAEWGKRINWNYRGANRHGRKGTKS